MKIWIGIVLELLGIACIIYAVVWQQVLCFQMFGVIFEKVFIPHWSALFYLGVIPLGAGFAMTNSYY